MVDYSNIKKEHEGKVEILSNDKINKKLLLDFEINGQLSEAEIKFLSLSKEKANSSNIISHLIKSNITLKNYENIFFLEKYHQVGGTINPEQAVRNIRYRDNKGTIIAIVQIDSVNKKIRMQTFGDIFPKQEIFSLTQVAAKLKNLAIYNKWTTEDGGVNQFNGNLEHRYKDSDGKVMAAIITKPNDTYDMIAEYSYNGGIKSQMLLTNQYGQSMVIYDGSINCIQQTRIDIDADGLIVEITKMYS